MTDHEQLLSDLLLSWFREDDKIIADEMTWEEIEKREIRRGQLRAAGIDP